MPHKKGTSTGNAKDKYAAQAARSRAAGGRKRQVDVSPADTDPVDVAQLLADIRMLATKHPKRHK